MVSTPRKREWRPTAICRAKKSSNGKKFLKIKFGVRNISCIDVVEGLNLVLSTGYYKVLCPASHSRQRARRAMNSVIYIVTGVTGSYRAKVLPCDTSKSNTVALGFCILKSTCALQIKLTLFPFVVFFFLIIIFCLSALMLLHRNCSSCPMHLFLTTSYSVWVALTQCKMNVNYSTFWGMIPS